MADELTAGSDSGMANLMSQATSQLKQIDWKKMAISLGLVIGGYLAFLMIVRWINPGQRRGLPPEVIEVLGNVPLNTRQNLQLVRLGSKLLLLIHGPDGTQSIGDISNPNEVEHLAQICSLRRGRRTATTFRKFTEPARDQNTPGIESLMRNLQQALQRLPTQTEYEA